MNMKKFFTLAASALMASAAWAGVITLDMNKPINPATIEYGANNVWTECYNDVDYTWLEFGDENGEFMLSHLIDGEGASWGGYYWDGFTPAIGGDITDYGQPGSSASWTTNFSGCMAGGGCVINADGSVTADPAQPYFVAYYSNWAMEGPSNQVMFVDKNGSTTFEPLGVYVCNHPWPYYGCLHGDGMARAFEEGDYFELIAHGVAADGTETTVSMNLVEFTNGELIAANDWTYFDLSNLGEVESVYFTLNSTDTGAYGMNTAAYFCMDKFQVKGEDGGDTPEPPTPTEKTQTPDGSYAVTPGQHEVVVTITPYEGDVYYRILYTAPDRYTSESDWMLYEAPFAVNEYGSYRIEFYAIAPGKLPSDPGAVEFSVGPMTGIEEMTTGKTVAGVRYFNMAGQEMSQANGLTIVVTTYTDGTSTAVKVMK